MGLRRRLDPEPRSRIIRAVTAPQDPRRWPRYAAAFAVEVAGPGGFQACQAEDVSAGGCRIVSVFPLGRGDVVRVRLRSDRVALEPSGAATVAWVSRAPPYRAGLAFSEPLAEQAARFVLALLGPVRLVNPGRQAG